MLKKFSLILLVAFIFAFIFTGCESAKPPVTLSPPTWIQGTWTASETNNTFISFVFTYDDVILVTSLDSYNFKNSLAKITETATTTNYTLTALDANNKSTIYDFLLISDNQLRFTYTVNAQSTVWNYSK